MSADPVRPRLDAVRAELTDRWPGLSVTARVVLDDRGVVAVLLAVGEGRLVVDAAAVELVPVEWGLKEGASLADCVGVLPSQLFPTVAEVRAGLEVVR